MELLRKRGKEKLRFRNMSHRVSNKDFNYFKRLFLECIRENEDIANSLIEYYKRIKYFFSIIGESLILVNQLKIFSAILLPPVMKDHNRLLLVVKMVWAVSSFSYST